MHIFAILCAAAAIHIAWGQCNDALPAYRAVYGTDTAPKSQRGRVVFEGKDVILGDDDLSRTIFEHAKTLGGSSPLPSALREGVIIGLNIGSCSAIDGDSMSIEVVYVFHVAIPYYDVYIDDNVPVFMKIDTPDDGKTVPTMTYRDDATERLLFGGEQSRAMWIFFSVLASTDPLLPAITATNIDLYWNVLPPSACGPLGGSMYSYSLLQKQSSTAAYQVNQALTGNSVTTLYDYDYPCTSPLSPYTGAYNLTALLSSMEAYIGHIVALVPHTTAPVVVAVYENTLTTTDDAITSATLSVEYTRQNVYSFVNAPVTESVVTATKASGESGLWSFNMLTSGFNNTLIAGAGATAAQNCSLVSVPVVYPCNRTADPGRTRGGGVYGVNRTRINGGSVGCTTSSMIYSYPCNEPGSRAVPPDDNIIHGFEQHWELIALPSIIPPIIVLFASLILII